MIFSATEIGRIGKKNWKIEKNFGDEARVMYSNVKTTPVPHQFEVILHNGAIGLKSKIGNYICLNESKWDTF